MHNNIKALWLDELIEINRLGDRVKYTPHRLSNFEGGSAWNWLCRAHQRTADTWGFRLEALGFSYRGFAYYPPPEVLRWAGLWGRDVSSAIIGLQNCKTLREAITFVASL